MTLVARLGGPVRLLELYLLLLGAGLLLEGVVMLLWPALPPASIPPFFSWVRPDPPHDALHALWGAAMLGVPLLRPRSRWVEALGLIFGVFYTAFGLLGILVYHPLGLELDLSSNVFHLVVGPLALMLAWWARQWLREANARQILTKPAQG